MKPLREKIRHAIRLDRAVRFVWQAGPARVTALGLLLVFQGAVPLAALYLMKQIIDTVSAAVTSPDAQIVLRQAWCYILLAGAVALLQTLIQAVSGLVREELSQTVSDRMYDHMHAKSISVDLDYYENPRYFDTLHRAQQEGPFRPTQIVNTLMQLGRSGVCLLAMAGLLFTFHWTVALILVLAAAPGILVRMKYSHAMFDWQKDRTADERRAMYYNWILTGNAHAKEVRLFHIGGEIADRFSRVRKTLRHEKRIISRKRAVADVFAQVFSILAIFGTFGAIAYRAVLGTITLGEMVMFYQAFQRGLGYLQEVLGGVADLYENNLFLSHLYDFLEFEPTVREPVEPLPLPNRIVEGVRFDHVGFAYPGAEIAVLKDISFTIGPGEVVALVGENGSGKTTIAKLLCRLYDPTEGRITVDDTSLDRFSTTALRRDISVIFQDFARYDLTVEDNIRFGNIHLSPGDSEAIRNAAIRSGADDVIRKLPRQYQTILGKLFKDGVELSIGEWQKIALARAFLRNSRLIVLDEPTSAMSVRAEHDVFQFFRELLRDRSALLISHRFSTVRMADRICVLEDGRIVEQGSHDELMGLGGRYARLYAMQAGYYR